MALKDALLDHPIVGDVRGMGFWQAVDFTRDKVTRAAFTDDTVAAIAKRCREHGVLVSPIGTAIEIAPPLISEKEHLEHCTAMLAQSVDEIARERGLAGV